MTNKSRIKRKGDITTGPRIRAKDPQLVRTGDPAPRMKQAAEFLLTVLIDDTNALLRMDSSEQIDIKRKQIGLLKDEQQLIKNFWELESRIHEERKDIDAYTQSMDNRNVSLLETAREKLRQAGKQ